jgi:hypothetical protein
MRRITKDDITQLFGHRLALVHETAFEHLQFCPNGFVLATVGTKNGPICAPLWHWSLTRDGRLLAYNVKRFLWVLWWVRDCIYLEWSSIRLDGAIVRVETPSGSRNYDIQTLSACTGSSA